MASAREAPIPGSVASSAAVAALTSISVRRVEVGAGMSLTMGGAGIVECWWATMTRPNMAQNAATIAGTWTTSPRNALEIRGTFERVESSTFLGGRISFQKDIAFLACADSDVRSVRH